MSAKEYSLLIENLLCKVNSSTYGKSDEILLNPYNVIVSSLEYRVSQEKLDKFKLYYQGIEKRTLKELQDIHYDLNQLLKDLQDLTENN